MAELTLSAVIGNIPVITEFADQELEGMDCPMKAQIQIDVAIDEIFSNIAYYAYAAQPEPGEVTLIVEPLKEKRGASLCFVDSGAAYNPLEKEDPDITLKLEDRGIGGLGIFMVKKTMSDVSYERADGKNRLTLIKEW